MSAMDNRLLPAEAHPTHPTLAESASRLWNRLPLLWKILIPVVVALLLVLVPANMLITSRFFAITTDNLRGQHQALLADLSNTFENFLSRPVNSLLRLANSDAVKNCTPTGCASSAALVFVPELAAELRQPASPYTEIGFIDLTGKETARAVVGTGGSVKTSDDVPPFSTDPASLSRLPVGQAYVFPVARDPRLSAVESYQEPVLRFAVPVLANGKRQGYVTAVVSLDDFFAQNFVYSDQLTMLLLDTHQCLLAISDDTRRAALYKTWSGDPGRVCYTDLQLEDWDITVQNYQDSIISTHVLHGVLNTSGQKWTIVVQQSAALAYAQANTLQTLLTTAHAAVIFLVVALIIIVDRASRQIRHAGHHTAE